MFAGSIFHIWLILVFLENIVHGTSLNKGMYLVRTSSVCIYIVHFESTLIDVSIDKHLRLINKDVILGIRLQSIYKEVVGCKLKSVHVILVIQSCSEG